MSSVRRLALTSGLMVVGLSCAGPPTGGPRHGGEASPRVAATPAPTDDPTPAAALAAVDDDDPELEGETGAVDEVLLGWADDTWLYLPTYVDLIRGIAPVTRVVLVVDGFEQQFTVAHELARSGIDLTSVEFVHGELDSMWMRDYGPLVVRTRGGGRRVLDALYGRKHDDEVPREVAIKLGLPHEDLPIELDGGHLQSDGEGRCVVSEDVVYLNVEDGVSEEQTLDILRTRLGCKQIVQVPPLLVEETGHVDVFLYVVGPRHVLLGRYRPWQDRDNHLRLEETARILTDAGFRVERLPMPGNDRRTVFRTYTNALAANQVVLVPTYRRDRRFERTALGEYRRIFPDRTIVPVRADDVIELGGALHCLAMTVAAP